MPPKAIPYQRPAKRAHAVELKGVVWFGLFFMALLAYAIWATANLYSNRPYVVIGKSVDCQTRPFPKALRCNPRVDGISCDEGSRNWLREWTERIDYACARVGPDPVFVFSTYRDLNWDQETIEIMQEVIDYADPPETAYAEVEIP